MRQILVLTFVLVIARMALADECASAGPVAEIDVPKFGSVVPPNVRFRIGLFRQCGGVETTLEHQFRILDHAGKVVPHVRATWLRSFVELKPIADLEPGAYVVETKRPVSQRELGSWETLTRVRVEGAPDVEPPDFSGISRAIVREAKGTRFLSPCEAYQGPVIATRIEFIAAKDTRTEHNGLLYVVERRRQGASDEDWDVYQTFRPKQTSGQWGFDWEEEEGWGLRWDLRVRARDLSGNETLGKRTASVEAPPRPTALDMPVEW